MQREEFGGYFTFLKDGKHVGGCMANSGEEGHPDSWTVYLTTDDVQRTAKDAAAKGGQVHMEPMQVAENGSFAIIGDPGGAGIGAWQADQVTGFEIWNEPGAPRWFELQHAGATTPASTSTATCSAGTPTRTATTPDFRYTTLREGEDDLAGIMEAIQYMPEGAPAFWTIYFGVDDTDAALERIVELGGKVMQPCRGHAVRPPRSRPPIPRARRSS